MKESQKFSASLTRGRLLHQPHDPWAWRPTSAGMGSVYGTPADGRCHAKCFTGSFSPPSLGVTISWADWSLGTVSALSKSSDKAETLLQDSLTPKSYTFFFQYCGLDSGPHAC
jgi:hypothetical protein